MADKGTVAPPLASTSVAYDALAVGSDWAPAVILPIAWGTVASPAFRLVRRVRSSGVWA
jgi:hypothetical protein